MSEIAASTVCFPIVRECVSVCCSLYFVRVLIVVI